jgi:hypothetical protein
MRKMRSLPDDGAEGAVLVGLGCEDLVRGDKPLVYQPE